MICPPIGIESRTKDHRTKDHWKCQPRTKDHPEKDHLDKRPPRCPVVLCPYTIGIITPRRCTILDSTFFYFLDSTLFRLDWTPHFGWTPHINYTATIIPPQYVVRGYSCLTCRESQLCWRIISLAYLEENWKTAGIFRSLSPARWVSWQLRRCLRGKWRVTPQCVRGLHCAIDHADWWLLTTSYRRSREQCCWHASSQAVSSVSQDHLRFHRTAHADYVSHQQKSLSTVKRFYLHAERRHQLTILPTPHARQQQLKHFDNCRVKSNCKIRMYNIGYCPVCPALTTLVTSIIFCDRAILYKRCIATRHSLVISK